MALSSDREGMFPGENSIQVRVFKFSGSSIDGNLPSHIEKLEPVHDTYWSGGLNMLAFDLNRRNGLEDAEIIKDPGRKFLKSVRVFWAEGYISLVCCELIPVRKYRKPSYNPGNHIKSLQGIMRGKQYMGFRDINPLVDIAVDQYLEAFLFEAISK